MSSLPAVSVIVPTFDSAEYIVEAIESVLAQTVAVHELIIVDDGSTDDTLDRLDPFVKSDLIRLIRQKNAGPHAARNRAIRESTGELIAFLDSDDIWYERKLERQLALFDGRRGCGVVYSARDWIDMDGNLIDGDFVSWRCVRGDRPTNELLLGNCVPMTTAVTHRETFERVGWFDEALRCASDWDYWLRASAYCWFDCVDERLAAHRMRQGQITSNRLAQVEGAIEIQNNFLQKHGDNVQRSVVRRATSNRLARRGKVRGKLGMTASAFSDLARAIWMHPRNGTAITDMARLIAGRLKD